MKSNKQHRTNALGCDECCKQRVIAGDPTPECPLGACGTAAEIIEEISVIRAEIDAMKRDQSLHNQENLLLRQEIKRLLDVMYSNNNL